MREWFERFGQWYLRVSWSEATALDLARYEEVPAWQVPGGAPRDVLVFQERREAWSGGTSGGGGGGGAAAKAPPPEEEAPVEKAPEVRAWIEVQLLDADGSPIAGETCRITLTNGKVVEQATDKYGLVRVADIDPGKCEVTFPKLADGIWAPA